MEEGMALSPGGGTFKLALGTMVIGALILAPLVLRRRRTEEPKAHDVAKFAKFTPGLEADDVKAPKLTAGVGYEADCGSKGKSSGYLMQEAHDRTKDGKPASAPATRLQEKDASSSCSLETQKLATHEKEEAVALLRKTVSPEDQRRIESKAQEEKDSVEALKAGLVCVHLADPDRKPDPDQFRMEETQIVVKLADMNQPTLQKVWYDMLKIFADAPAEILEPEKQEILAWRHHGSEVELAVKGTVCKPKGFCTARVKAYQSAGCILSLEFQRRCGEHEAFYAFYDGAAEFYTGLKGQGVYETVDVKGGQVRLSAPVLLDLSFEDLGLEGLPEVESVPDFEPLLEMAGLDQAPSLQAEAAAALEGVSKTHAKLLVENPHTSKKICILLKTKSIEIDFPAAGLLKNLWTEAATIDVELLKAVADKIMDVDTSNLAKERLALALEVVMNRPVGALAAGDLLSVRLAWVQAEAAITRQDVLRDFCLLRDFCRPEVQALCLLRGKMNPQDQRELDQKVQEAAASAGEGVADGVRLVPPAEKPDPTCFRMEETQIDVKLKEMTQTCFKQVYSDLLKIFDAAPAEILEPVEKDILDALRPQTAEVRPVTVVEFAIKGDICKTSGICTAAVKAYKSSESTLSLEFQRRWGEHETFYTFYDGAKEHFKELERKGVYGNVDAKGGRVVGLAPPLLDLSLLEDEEGFEQGGDGAPEYVPDIEPLLAMAALEQAPSLQAEAAAALEGISKTHPKVLDNPNVPPKIRILLKANDIDTDFRVAGLLTNLWKEATVDLELLKAAAEKIKDKHTSAVVKAMLAASIRVALDRCMDEMKRENLLLPVALAVVEAKVAVDRKSAVRELFRPEI